MNGPQFVVGGPRIPSEITWALEEERLVFFCGAGISIGTGLPNFADLTLEAIKHIDGAPEDIPAHPAIRDAYCLGLYDKALDILEDIEGHRGDFRRFVAKRLTKRLRNAQEQLRLHKALLDLSRLPSPDQGERGYRLVTTNYDDRFEKAGLPRRWIEAAPLLARPQANRVGYATFLHGRIETERAKRDPGLKSLVLTSADFGDAYLRDGYATRFVLELFREFTVLFIGYSLNDPVMRYLMDIFATENDESAEGQFRPAYAFVAHGDEDAEHQRQLWEAKHVVPILYHNADRHEILTKTLENWAHVHRAASDGRFQILIDVVTKPFQGDVDADNLANAAWALSDRGHRTARRLGSVNSVDTDVDAHISWFGPLLNATVIDPTDDRRPLNNCQIVQIDKVVIEMCRWAMRHLDSRHLVTWAISNENMLLSRLRQPFFSLVIEKLNNSTNNSLGEPFRLFWQLLVDVAAEYNELRDWDTFWRIVPNRRIPPDELQSIISRLQARLRWPAQPFGIHLDEGGKPERLQDLARYEISDRLDHRDHHRFRDIFSVGEGRNAEARDDLWSLTDDLTSLLAAVCRLGTRIDALFTQGLSREIRASIVTDVRNQLELDDWEWLIEALVQSFEDACNRRQDLAVCVAQRWRMIWQMGDQALFGRLYLHAATRLQELSVDEVIRICLDRGNVLWGYEYEPEFLALLRVRGAQITDHWLRPLMEQLLDGSVHEVSRSPDIDSERRKRLAKLVQGGVRLEGLARTLAEEYLAGRPPSEDPREDEVRYRVVEAGWVGPPSGKDLVGKNIDEIIELVDRGRDEHGFAHDKWSKAKQVDDWLRQEEGRIAETLEALSRRDDTPAGFVDGVFWALRDVATQRVVLEQTNRIAATLSRSPGTIDASFDSCSAWIKALAKADVSDETFWPIWDSVRARAPADDAVLHKDMSLTAAINSAVGYLTEAVIDRLWKTEPKAGGGLPTDVRERLTRLVSGTSRLGVHARLVCMPPLHALYAVDPDWTRQELLPHLNWSQEPDQEVSALWSTYFSYGRWSLDLMAAFKDEFLTSLRKQEALGEHAYRSACWRFAALGIDRPGFLSNADIRDGFHNMGPEGAVFVLDLFETRLRQSEQPESQWRKMIAPWLMTYWPRQERFRTAAARTAAAEMLLQTGEAFAEALRMLEDLHLVGLVDQNRPVLFRLARAENANAQQESGSRFPYASSFPDQVCRWLDRTLPPNVPGHDRHYLNTIIEAIQRGVEGRMAPQCLLHLRERAR
jgi:SIR2-like domain